MRCTLENSNGFIIKSVAVDYFVYQKILENFLNYSDWLKLANIAIPETQIVYENSKVIFKQNLIKSNSNDNIGSIIDALKFLDYKLYGIDASPSNFIFSGENLYYVDFFPFLMDDRFLLEKQFDYNYDIIIQRYFKLPNILVTFVNRLFKTSFKDAQNTLLIICGDLSDSYDSILPREKIRLLFALKNFNNNLFYNNYKEYYKETKIYNFVSSTENEELRNLLYNMKTYEIQ